MYIYTYTLSVYGKVDCTKLKDSRALSLSKLQFCERMCVRFNESPQVQLERAFSKRLASTTR